LKKTWMIIIFAAILVAVLLAPFASSSPDGLEKVAEDLGFAHKSFEAVDSPIPDYVFPGITSERLATAAAGVLGTLITFILALGLGRLFVRKNAVE